MNIVDKKPNLISSNFFAFGEKCSFARRLFIYSMVMLIWTFLAFSIHPLIGINEKNWFFQLFLPAKNQSFFLFQKTLAAMLSFDVILFMLGIRMAWNISRETIASFSAAWWGFKKVENLVGFINTVAFGKIYLPRFQISNGKILIQRGTAWLLKTGGPAKYSISPGNVVLIETNSNLKVIKNPLHAKSQMDGCLNPFEFLVSAFEMKDLIIRIGCEGRTKDGKRIIYKNGILQLTWRDDIDFNDFADKFMPIFSPVSSVNLSNLTQAVCTDTMIKKFFSLESLWFKSKSNITLSTLTHEDITKLLKRSFLRRAKLQQGWRHCSYIYCINFQKARNSFLRITTGRLPWIYPRGTKYLRNTTLSSTSSWHEERFHHEILEDLELNHPLSKVFLFSWKEYGNIFISQENPGAV